MQRDGLRRWVEGYRAAQERDRADVAAVGPPPEAAIASALALIALAGRLHGWPPPRDEADRRADDAVIATWDRLRSVLHERGRKG